MNPEMPVPAPAFELFHLLLTAGILAAAVLLGVVVQRVVASSLHARAKRTASEWDDIVVESMRGLVVVWFLLIGLAVVLKFVPLQPDVLRIVRRAVGVLGILSAVVFFTRMARRAIHIYIDRKVEVTSSIFKNFATGIIYILGFLFVLDYLGISITPLLTALGVGGLAVALAFQDTLSNLFAGHEHPHGPQDQAGRLRPPRLRRGRRGLRHHLAQHDHPRPRGQHGRRAQRKLASAIYTNTHLPTSEMGLFLPVTVAFDSDLALVERVTLEVAREVLAGPERAIPDFAPAIRYNAYTDIGVRFSVILRIKEFREQYKIRHEFYRRLHARYKEEGIKLAVAARLAAVDKP